MSWKQVAGFLVIVFGIVMVQTTIAGPLYELQTALLTAVDLQSSQFNGAQLIRNLFSSWFNMGLVAIFLLAAVVIARIVRRELTRQGRPPK